MKRFLIIILGLISTSTILHSQSNIPQLVSFSAEVRDASNQLLINTNVSLRLTFREGGQSGSLVYCALHQTTTNENGFLSIQLNRAVLGTGCNGAPSTAFENISWENGGYWMEVEYQLIPTAPFTNLGQLELASSFYAFAAQSAERLAGFDIDNPNDGDVISFNGVTGIWEAVPSDTSWLNPSVSQINDTLFFGNGSFVIVPGVSAANFGVVDPCAGVTCAVGDTCINGNCVPITPIACQPCGTFDGTMDGNLQIPLTGTDTTFTGVSITAQVDENAGGNYDFSIDMSALLGAPAGTLVPTVEAILSGTTLTITNQNWNYQGIANFGVDGIVDFNSSFSNILNSSTLTFSGDWTGTINFDGVRQ
tara:strand:+ start:941 stop:2032 length:1092 start_codon:yes stop_codon:yes gene_type:complete